MTEQKLGGIIPYPTGVLRRLMRLPVYAYRLGLGNVLGFLPYMILTTRGRKSGLPRHTALEFRRHGSKLYLLSGWGKRPDWVQNLQAHPTVTVQIGRQRFSARAQVVVDPAEAVRALYMFRRTAPVIYDAMLARMSTAETINLNALSEVANEFIVVRLDRTDEEPALPGVAPDRAWLLPLVLAFVVMVILSGAVDSRRRGRRV